MLQGPREVKLEGSALTPWRPREGIQVQDDAK